MPFLSELSLRVPTKDIVSWCFDEPQYDLDDRVYLDALEPDLFYTGNTAKSTIRKLGAGFRAIGLSKGDCVCLVSYNNLHYPVIANGIVAFGGVFSGTNPSWTTSELVHAARAAKISAFVAEPSLIDSVAKAADEVGIPRSRVLTLDHHREKEIPEGFASWRSLLKYGEKDWVRFDDETTSRNSDAARLFSSGTTGLPKAAVISHYNFIAQHIMYNDWQQKEYKVRRLMALPLFHVASVPTTSFSPLRNGCPLWVLRRFELEPFLSCVERHKITDLLCVPPVIISIIMSPLTKNYSLESIKWAHCGAAPLGKETQARFKELLPLGTPMTQVWGMTETTCIATFLPYPEDDVTGSVGYVCPGLDVKLVDDDNKDITAYDIRGEMCIRGPTVIRGYLDNAEANRNSFDQDGYFHTGDIMYCDRKTRLWYLVDRKKELIKVRGFQVAPPELEAVLLSHPEIVDCAVIGIKQDESSELPRAYVVRRAGPGGVKVSESAVISFVAERVAKYKRLDGGVVFLDQIPRNPSGKILKKDLRLKADKETSAKL